MAAEAGWTHLESGASDDWVGGTGRGGWRDGCGCLTEATIGQSVSEVASYVADPSNAPEWYRNIESMEWTTDPPVRVGSRMAFVARFLGLRLAYEYEVIEPVPGGATGDAYVRRAVSDGNDVHLGRGGRRDPDSAT